MVESAEGFGFTRRKTWIKLKWRQGFSTNSCGGGDILRRGEQVDGFETCLPHFGIGRVNGVGSPVRFFYKVGRMDGLSVDELQGQVTRDLCVAATGVGGEVRFGEDGGRARFGEEGAEDFERMSAADDEIGIMARISLSRA